MFAHFEVDVEPEVFGLHLPCLSVHVGQRLRVSVLFCVCAAVYVLQCVAVRCSVLQCVAEMEWRDGEGQRERKTEREKENERQRKRDRKKEREIERKR